MPRIVPRHLGIAAIGGLALLQASFMAASAQESPPATPTTDQNVMEDASTACFSAGPIGGGTTVTIQSGDTTIIIITGEKSGFSSVLSPDGSTELIEAEDAAEAASSAAEESPDSTETAGGSPDGVSATPGDEQLIGTTECEVVDEIIEVAPDADDATGTPEVGSLISPADAIAIAQDVADGEFVSVSLTELNGKQVYEVTVGSTVVIVDAATGEVVNPAS